VAAIPRQGRNTVAMESLGVRRFICRRLLLRPLLVAAGQAAMLFLTQVAVAAEALPVTVPVASLRTLLRSGPGDDFYPTERLPQGTTLEVWAIDDSGYSAVRPVAGSFSWVRADDVSEAAAAAAVAGFERSGVGDGSLPMVPAAGGRTGVVVTDGAVARVGSQLNDLRHVSQVALEAGERVRILARVTVSSGRHAGEWLKIEPPSGEFRWAWSADLGLPGELAPVAQREPAGVGLAAAGEAIAAMRDARDAVTQAVAEAEAAGPLAAAAGQPGTLDQSGGIGRLMSGWLPRGTNVFDLTPPPPPAVVDGGAAAQAADELADIDLALSLAVAGPSDRIARRKTSQTVGAVEPALSSSLGTNGRNLSPSGKRFCGLRGRSISSTSRWQRTKISSRPQPHSLPSMGISALRWLKVRFSKSVSQGLRLRLAPSRPCTGTGPWRRAKSRNGPIA